MRLILLILGALLVALLSISFFFSEISALEIRLYIWLFLILVGVNTFANLRIYNAIVVNSDFLFKLQVRMKDYLESLKKLNNQMAESVKYHLAAKDKLGDVAEVIKEWIRKL